MHADGAEHLRGGSRGLEEENAARQIPPQLAPWSAQRIEGIKTNSFIPYENSAICHLLPLPCFIRRPRIRGRSI